MSITQENSKKMLTLCIPETEKHGRIDMFFEFRNKEDDRLWAMQECVLENFLRVEESAIVNPNS